MTPEPNMFDIVKRAHDEMSCGVCGRDFAMEEIKIRGMMDGHYLVQTSCHRGHAPALLLYVVSTVSKPADAMSTDDVLDLHQTLKAFDGNFADVFSQLEKNSQN